MKGGGEVVEELQGDVVKLVVSSIGVEKGREQVLHGGQGGGGWRSTATVKKLVYALGIQLGGCTAPRDQEEST
jgi:hypothetical protein